MIPDIILSSPSLLFLYYRIEQILGVISTPESLIKLNEYLEKCTGASYVKDPAAFEYILDSREHIYEISKLITIAETYFFREGVHFDLLLKLLPKYTGLNRPVQICSAATSIGCEAYSIAMLLDYYSKNTEINFEIDAFDINSEVIETAKTGRYTSNALRTDGSAWKYILDSYLFKDGSEYIVSQDIRKMVRFFNHNIMRGLQKKYDIIFFRNALIYFSPRNRVIVTNELVESLADNGILFTGISETSSVNHPLLANKHISDIFFFQKITMFNQLGISDQITELKTVKKMQNYPTGYPVNDNCRNSGRRIHKNIEMEKKPLLNQTKPYTPKQTNLPVDCMEICSLLEDEEGQPNAKTMLFNILSGSNDESISGSSLAASVIFFLNIQDFDSANFVLSYMEKYNHESAALFLRGEYHLLKGNIKEAEDFFGQAAGKDSSFWPALYRAATLAVDGNQTRYKYKIVKACESIELGKNRHYECFMGGFSPDYFYRILNRRIPDGKLT